MPDMRYAVTLAASEIMGRVHVQVVAWEYPADPDQADKRLWKRTVDAECHAQPGSADWVQEILEQVEAAL